MAQPPKKKAEPLPLGKGSAFCISGGRYRSAMLQYLP